MTELYIEKTYAGVLGKLIGVYLGRPFEGWTYERIAAELGEVWYYVHEKLNKPLIVADDDISGTFTFLRALENYDYDPDLSSRAIGRTWLNYLIEHRTVLWWGGLGNSTEHTAYLRLANGIDAPESGSIGLNGKVVAEQIGAQIFIDGWAMVCPGDPERAVDLAGRAARVSHDGEAVYAAQVLAAMEAAAFEESDINKLLDTGTSFIPKDSVVFHLISDLRDWRNGTDDWHTLREKLSELYGYDTYGGNCHVIPNHGLIVLSLLCGDDDFQKTLMIVNTCGWDTDCNSGNVGCLMGIKNGLAGLETGPDWRGPVADRLYLPTADGGGAATDAVRETYRIINTFRALSGSEPLAPKDGARFHFELPGSVQGFVADDSPECRDISHLENVDGHSELGTRALAIRYRDVSRGRTSRIGTNTFIQPETFGTSGYMVVACPSLYSGQKVQCVFSTDSGNAESVSVGLYLKIYNAIDELEILREPAIAADAGTHTELDWVVPDTGGYPIAEIGLEISSETRANGFIYLDSLTWTGEPKLELTRPAEGGTVWAKAWANGVDAFETGKDPFRLIQNRGRGLLIHGSRDWHDYTVTADVTAHMARAAGIGARVQGMRRYYALLMCDDAMLRLMKFIDSEIVLAEEPFETQFGVTHELSLSVKSERIEAFVDGTQRFSVEDSTRPLACGGIALLCEAGRTATQVVRIAGS